MDKLSEYIQNNFKLAYKSVTFHFKRFIWFYIALFIIQTMLGLISISSHINSLNIRETVSKEYSSQYVFYYMNTNQKLYLQKSARYIFKNLKLFKVDEIEDYGEVTDQNYKCNVYISFYEDPEKGLETFNRRYLEHLEKLGQVYSAPTPLFYMNSDIKTNEGQAAFYMLIVSAVSLLVLSILYNIRSNNYRFDYGIYMAFGADKKKLLNTSFWEMTVITLLTFLPSILTAGLINYIFAKQTNSIFDFNIFSCLIVLLIALSVCWISILHIVIKTALKTPNALIISANNSNYVISPRVSVDLLQTKSLAKVARLSRRRYLKYYVSVIFSGVVFSAIFSTLVFCSNLYSQKLNHDDPEFTVQFSTPSVYSEKIRQSYLSLEGIEGTFKESFTPADGLLEHMLVNKENTGISAQLLKYDDDFYVMDNINYHAADSEVLDFLSSKEHTGDLSSIFQNNKTVIISDSFSNTTHFKFAPGDKIYLADFIERKSEPFGILAGKDLLKERLKCYTFSYTEYTVGAVIHNDCSNEKMKIFFNADSYRDLTGNSPSYDTVHLYMDDKATSKNANEVFSTLLYQNLNNCRDSKNTVTAFTINNYSLLKKQIETNELSIPKILATSYFILILSALIWFFSQFLFYGKRNNEFNLLRAIGANNAEIRKIFLQDSIMISIIAVISYFILSTTFCFAAFKLFNSWIFGYSLRFSFDLPAEALIIGGTATLLFAFVSTFITYFSFRKNNISSIPEV